MSDQNERENILNKIRAMLAKADPERGGTQAEIEAFAAKAKEWMDKYSVTMLELMREKKDDPNFFTSKEASYTVAKMKAWHWSLARAISRICTTRYYSTSTWGKSERRKRDVKDGANMKVARMSFYGMGENVSIAAELFDKWCDRIDLMGTAAVSEYIKELEEEFADEMLAQGVKQIRFLKGLYERHPNTWRTGWLDGCLSGIHAAIFEEEEKARDNERAKAGLVPLAGKSWAERRKIQEAERAAEAPVMTFALALTSVQEIVDEKYEEFSKGFRHVNSTASRNTNYSAHEKGYAVGKNIRLNSKELKS